MHRAVLLSVGALVGLGAAPIAIAAPPGKIQVASHELVHRKGFTPRLRVRQIRVTPATAAQKPNRNTVADLAAWTSAALVPIGEYRLPRDMERGWGAFFALLPPELHTCEAINDGGTVLIRPDHYARLRDPSARASEAGVATALHELMHSALRRDGRSRRDGVMKQIHSRTPDRGDTVHLYFEEAAAELSTALLMTARTGRPYWRDHRLAYSRATRRLAGYLVERTGSPSAALEMLRHLMTETRPGTLIAEAAALDAWLGSGKRSPRGAMGRMADALSGQLR